MGAWGMGTLTNDSALDGIDAFGLDTDDEKEIAKLKKIKPAIWLKKFKKEDSDDVILGAASVLLLMGCDISGCESLIMKSVNRERKSARNYIEPKEREEALNLFVTLLEQKKLSKPLMKRWNFINRGLFARI